MFDVLRDRLEPLFMSLSKLFTDPLGSLKAFAQAIKDNLINRVKGLIDTFGALGKVVKGVFTRDMELLKEGANEAKTAFIQLNTGLDEIQQSKVAETFSSITEEINKETEAAGKLTEKFQEIRDRERDMLSVRAQANQIIAKSRLLAEDDTKSLKERLEALKEAVAEEKRVATIEMAIQKDKVDAMQEMIDLGKSSEEDIQNLAVERARLTELQTASILKQKRVAAEIGTFTSQVAKEEEKIEKERLERIDLMIKAKEHNLQVTEEMTNKEIKELIKKSETEKKLEDKAIDDLRKATLNKEELELDALKTKHEKLLAESEKYGLDTTELTEQYNQQVQDIQDKYDQAELEKKKKLEDEKFALANQRIDQAQQIFGTIAQIAQEELNAEKIALQKQLDEGLISQEEFDRQSEKIEKEAVKREKKNALLQILIDSAQGVAAAIKAGAGVPFPANLGAILTGVGAVLSGILSAKQILNKVPGGGGGGGDDSVQQPQITRSIPNIQATEQPTLGEQPPIQAYVIENDISNAQALQEELEIQSTL